MSQHLPKTLPIAVASSTLIPVLARSQSTPSPQQTQDSPSLTNPADQINKNIEKNYPSELLEDGSAAPKQQAAPTKTHTTATTDANTTAVGSSNYTFVLSTPLLIAMLVVIGGIALFPVVHVLISSKKFIELSNKLVFSKFTDKFQNPKILESDEFLHQRSFDFLTSLTSQAENLHADKFGNHEFTVFVKIKSFIARSIGEYAGLDDSIDMLTAAIGAQNSFLVIDGGESRHCSTTQQELYKLVNTLLAQELDPGEFKQQVDRKLAEVLPLLKTEEGKIALQAYATEIGKVAQHPLGLKLLLLFKKYQFDDFATLRSVSNTINQLGNEDLLNLDGLLLLVMVKYDVFEKLGPILGVETEYNRPETYAKMLQYMGLKAQHEVAYGKFTDFLLLIKQWEIHYKTAVNVRNKYNPKEYRLSKNFTAALPGLELYQKYKDSLQLVGVTTNLNPNPNAKNSIAKTVVWDVEADVLAEAEADIMVGTK